MRNLRKIFNIAGVFAAIILGAGFASGQELIKFFVKFGQQGFLGIAVAGLVLALVGWAVMDLVLAEGIRNYSQFSEKIMGRHLGLFMETVIACFLFVLFATMLAAAGATLKESLHIPEVIGGIIMSGLCFFCFTGNLERITKISAFLAPIMILGGVFIGLFIVFIESRPAFFLLNSLGSLGERNWLVSSILYASYNMITAIAVLATMYNSVPNRKVAFWGPVLGGLAVSVLGVCMSLPLMSNYFFVADAQIPLLKIAMRHGDFIKNVYLFILLSAIFTTALANGFAFIEWLCGRVSVPKRILTLFVCFAAVLVAQFGFSNFVSKIYPLFGYIGLFEMTVIILNHCRKVLIKKR